MQETRATKLTCNQQCVTVFNSNMDVLAEQRYANKFCLHLKENTAETILL